MKIEQLEKVIDRYLAGMATAAEKELLQQWFDKTAEEPVHLSAASRQRITREMWQQIRQPDMRTRAATIMARLPRHFLQYAATLLILMGVAIYLLVQNPHIDYTAADRPLAYEQVITGPGQVRTVLLSDSSKIYLSPNSTIQIPENYGLTDRTVLLAGKAFFDVKRNSGKQFTVQVGKLVTHVLGTSFEVNGFPAAAQMTVTVATGKVGVAYAGRLLSHLTPRQQLSYNHLTTQFSTTTILTPAAGSWITGKLVFQQTPLQDVCRTLEEWFNVKITIDNRARLKEHITVGFRGESLEKTLAILSQTAGFTYTVDKHNIHIH
ncbi:FecR family protein [Chitinophaga nivalis]|uniref:DUF4974 domain-containing protein n=1 Tax=Chitinophaga nivalis TaxID=2991709 RepID=A0ABT3IES9_9BACT|nr:FecR domain-containing protein [Chitinophaga nivalis]MCW3467852.1 DUF4974 domain-containing protein [Chitinophaga nivalis]MCW3482456.1 DUF4974 domain-containing protein [Chitinophaga nivalis]